MAILVLSSRIEFGTPPKKPNARCGLRRRLGRLVRIGLYEAGIAVRQVKREEVDILFHPADLCQRLAEVDRRGHEPLIFAHRTAYQKGQRVFHQQRRRRQNISVAFRKVWFFQISSCRCRLVFCREVPLRKCIT
jgi:hypothetical protein